MVILLTGASHAGKTFWAQRLLERYGFPYLSIDHLKMGLIRAGLCPLTPESPDEELTAFLWPVVREIVKTAVENGQDLIVEGCYIPFDWQRGFGQDYLAEIKYLCLVFSRNYILSHFDRIKACADIAERRGDDSWCTQSLLLEDNARILAECRAHGCPCLLIDSHYPESISELEAFLC